MYVEILFSTFCFILYVYNVLCTKYYFLIKMRYQKHKNMYV